MEGTTVIPREDVTTDRHFFQDTTSHINHSFLTTEGTQLASAQTETKPDPRNLELWQADSEMEQADTILHRISQELQ